MPTSDAIDTYTSAQESKHAVICRLLRKEIDTALPNAVARMYHSVPVWFIGDNAVVGFSSTSKGVNLLFWNGQSFKEGDLVPVGKFKAAQAQFEDTSAIDPKRLRRWLNKARTDVWDLASIRRASKPG